MKISIVVPVYFNEDNLIPLYEDIKRKIIDIIDYDYEIVMVNDGSQDDSYQIMQQLAEKDKHKKTSSKSLIMAHAYSNVLIDKIEEAIKNGVIGNENEDW